VRATPQAAPPARPHIYATPSFFIDAAVTPRRARFSRSAVLPTRLIALPPLEPGSAAKRPCTQWLMQPPNMLTAL
jgi:hypothetical protein